jgi:hypothetical protein
MAIENKKKQNPKKLPCSHYPSASMSDHTSTTILPLHTLKANQHDIAPHIFSWLIYY